MGGRFRKGAVLVGLVVLGALLVPVARAIHTDFTEDRIAARIDALRREETYRRGAVDHEEEARARAQRLKAEEGIAFSKVTRDYVDEKNLRHLHMRRLCFSFGGTARSVARVDVKVLAVEEWREASSLRSGAGEMDVLADYAHVDGWAIAVGAYETGAPAYLVTDAALRTETLPSLACPT